MEKDKLFESHVDIIKYKVLRELARQTWAGRDAFMAFNDIANVVVKRANRRAAAASIRTARSSQSGSASDWGNITAARIPYRSFRLRVMNARSPGMSSPACAGAVWRIIVARCAQRGRLPSIPRGMRTSTRNAVSSADAARLPASTMRLRI